MGLFQAIVRRLNPEIALSELADQIADLAFDGVWKRVRTQLPTLPAPEMRGYVRARGALVLRPHFHQAVERHAVVSGRRAQLYALATEALIRRVQQHALTIAADKTQRRAA